MRSLASHLALYERAYAPRMREVPLATAVGESHASRAVVHHSVRFLFGCVVACVAAGCGGNSVSTTTGPSPVKCATSLSGLPVTLPATGTNVQATVTAERECSWSATTDVSWVKLNPATGQGEGSVTVAVAANDTPVARAGAIVINGARVTVSQAPALCRFDLDRQSAQVAAAGGRVPISIAAMAGCAWKVSSPVPWVGTLARHRFGQRCRRVDRRAKPGRGAIRRARRRRAHLHDPTSCFGCIAWARTRAGPGAHAGA